MMAISDYISIGSKFGMLTIIGEPFPVKHYQFKVLCRCECGIEKEVNVANLKAGHTKSCGCLRNMAYRLTHGHSRKGRITKTYSVYRDMITRCENHKYREFSLYGGRGIKVCQRWRDRYENFLDDMGERPDGLTLERIDVDGDYEPGNCRWASVEEQANNKRNSRFIEYGGKRQTVAQWSRELGIPSKTIYGRLGRGWSPARTLSPSRNKQ